MYELFYFIENVIRYILGGDRSLSTIQDVANKAGVSVATVSRVLNKSDKVAEKSRIRVEEAIKELNYQPNLLGRNLRQSATKKIVVLLPTLANSFYSKLVKGMDDVASEHGYKLMLITTRMKRKVEEEYIEMLRTKLIDGVILTRPVLSPQELSQLGKNYPMVQCCEFVKDAHLSSVSIEDEKAAYEAVNYLIHQGHKKIACFTSFSDQSGMSRLRGYEKALKEHDIAIDESLIKDTNYSFTQGQKYLEELMELEERPTALFAVSDSLAVGVMRGMYEKDLTPGKDLAVIGFDNTEIARMYHPTLTTVSQPRYELGSKAMALLIDYIQKGNYQDIHHIRLAHELKIRESTEWYSHKI